MTRRYDRYAIVAMLLSAGCDLVFPPGAGPASDAPQRDGVVADGSPDEDTDDDGVMDDIDNCVDESNTDQLDGDEDGDGDVCDNCVMVGNPDQRNEDDDGFGDACDACPGMANADFDTELPPDGVGDACDPNPCDHEDRRVKFDGFGEDPGWISDTAAWTHGADDITVQTIAPTRYVATGDPGRASVMTAFKVSTAPPWTVGVEMRAQAAGAWDGLRCVVMDSGGSLSLQIETDSGALDGQAFAGPLEVPAHLILRLTPGGASATNAYCEVRRANGSIQVSANATAVPGPGTNVGLYAASAEADFHWFDLVQRANSFPPVGCATAR